eukprot:m.40436 g.40436  ORF g.40436 m.40436 type:complete len:139 (+) comp14816_c0_seq3:517-933(+)
MADRKTPMADAPPLRDMRPPLLFAASIVSAEWRPTVSSSSARLPVLPVEKRMRSSASAIVTQTSGVAVGCVPHPVLGRHSLRTFGCHVIHHRDKSRVAAARECNRVSGRADGVMHVLDPASGHGMVVHRKNDVTNLNG